ncbi:MAG: sulfurtransferase, partial [Gammaproteobacteria bacterium]|nr:sulfurtransferase [Gammaproteobacteria bacterium]
YPRAEPMMARRQNSTSTKEAGYTTATDPSSMKTQNSVISGCGRSPYTFVSLTGATLGAVLAFLLSRYLASDWVEQKTGGRLKQLKEGVEAEGWRFVAFVRLVPLFPFNLLNYALGLTQIRFLHYLVATYICMLPGAIAYTYLGYAGREAAAGGEGLIQKGLLALALLAMVAFLPRIISRFRQGPTLSIEALNERIQQDDELLLLDVRSDADYQGELGHIADSLNIPLEALESRLSELTAYQEKTVALICTTDRRSKKAAQLLTKRGFADVHVVAGGMKQWNEDGLPTQ